MHQIYRIKTNVSGQIHIMSAPPAERLEDVCRELSARNVCKLISLLTDDDIAALGLSQEALAAHAQGIDFIRIPIVDFGLPEPTVFGREVSPLCKALVRGESIAIHCRAAIGRTGVLASCILKGLGYSSADAMASVAAARRAKIPDTEAQRRFIEEFQLDT